MRLTGPALRALRTLGLNGRCAAAGFAISGINNCDVRGNLFHSVEPPSLLGSGQPIKLEGCWCSATGCASRVDNTV